VLGYSLLRSVRSEGIITFLNCVTVSEHFFALLRKARIAACVVTVDPVGYARRMNGALH
jgi:hypothetical protein